MNNKTDTDNLLLREKKYLVIFMASLTVAILSSISTHLIHGLFVWKQFTYLLHVLSSLCVIIIFPTYLYSHFKRTLGVRRITLHISGWVLLAVISCLIVTGLIVIIFGVTETTRWIIKTHIYAGYVLIGLLALHLIFHKILKIKRSTKFNTLNSSNVNVLWKSSGSSLTLILILTYLYQISYTDYKTSPSIEPYAYPYGEHPFRPSQTETANKQFIDVRQIANSQSCASCHEQIFNEWRSSMHNQSASDPTYVKNISLLADKKGIEATRYCEGCHAPVALLTGELSKGGKHAGKSETLAHHEGVSCMSCHGISKAAHLKGVASYVFQPADDYLFANLANPIGQKIHNFLIKIHPEKHRETMSRPILKNPELCATCHVQFMDKDMNDWGWIKMQDEYSAWLESQYSGQTKQALSRQDIQTCKSCHMPKIPGIDPSSNHDGLIVSHRALGANTAIPYLKKDWEQLQLTKQFLQSGKIIINIKEPWRSDATQSEQYIAEEIRSKQVLPYFFYLGETAHIKLSVANSLVGHDFPGGTTDINEAWIHFSAIDAENNIIYESGHIEENNHVEKSAYFYQTTPIDRQGKPVWKHDLFNMVGDSYKNTIPAGGSDIVEYSFKIPYTIKSPMTITATVNYRKFNQRYAVWALNNKDIILPIVEMARDAIVIPIKIRPKLDK